MSLIVKLIPFALCYASLLILFSFLARKIAGLIYPVIEAKGSMSFVVFALLCAIMALVSVPAFFLFVDRNISFLLHNHFFFMLSVILGVQFFLSLYVVLSCKRESFHVFRNGAREMFAGIILVIILSCIMISIIISTIF